MKRTIVLLLTALACALTTISAQSDYNYQRRSLFEILPITNEDIVFLGNSITDGCEWNELFGNNHIKNRGISGDRVQYLDERLAPIISGHPCKVFLMIGINDVADKLSAEKIFELSVAVIERFIKESPETALYIQSMLPVNPTKPKMAKNVARGVDFSAIVKINAMLQQLCADKELTYIDIHSSLVDANGYLDEKYSNDGLHLLGSGYIVWRDLLLPYVAE